ncbi:MAG: asparaginase [Anaerolineales bacterium]|nr:asparaginase [Anaerolineales bacterium]
MSAPYQPLVEFTRGGVVESVHYGALAMADTRGRLVASYGDPYVVTFMRSSAKPFQALPLVETGASEAFKLPPSELALVCASHRGLDMHAEAAASLQARIGASQDDLLCGTHEVGDPTTARRLASEGVTPLPNRHNCSGKHSGMLVLARHHGWPLADYVNPSHPVQQLILQTFAEMCSLPPADVVVGIDGCSAPNFAVPLVSAATAYARLADPTRLPHRRANSLRTLFYAMTAYPEMVCAPGAFDTELMRRRPGLLVAKGGAEGYQGLSLAANALRPGSPALGIALKVSDGAGRAVHVAVLEVLRQLGLLDDADFGALAEFGFGPRLPLRNYRQLVVGEARPVFTLDYSGGPVG